MGDALLMTDLGSLPLLARGKVRDIYAASGGAEADLVFVATDRISAFDHVLGSGIPGKGRILNQISLFWFEFLRDVVPNHVVTAEVSEFPALLRPYAGQLEGRTMLVRRARMFPVECVARGYLSGSGWKDYQATGAVCGIALPAGLRESDRLPEPIFTPAAKINTGGHDENISFDAVVGTIGEEYAHVLRRLTLEIYAKASEYAAAKGVILADTKFEFGLVDGFITLADEVLTPSFDKQYVRDYLESIRWNKQAPAPALPEEVVARTRAKYMQAFRLLTGRAGL